MHKSQNISRNGMYQFKKQWLAFEFFPIEKIAFNCQLFKVFIRNWFYRNC